LKYGCFPRTMRGADGPLKFHAGTLHGRSGRDDAPPLLGADWISLWEYYPQVKLLIPARKAMRDRRWLDPILVEQGWESRALPIP